MLASDISKKRRGFVKKRLIFVVAVTVIIGITTFYPRDIIGIIGEEPRISEDAHIRVIIREGIDEPSTTHEVQSRELAEEIFEYFEEYKYRRTNRNYSELDEMHSYSIRITDSGEEVFYVTVRGSEYISIRDKRGNYFIYKLWGDQFDLEYLERYHQSLSN